MNELTEKTKQEEENGSLRREHSRSHLLRRRWPWLVLLVLVMSCLGVGYWSPQTMLTSMPMWPALAVAFRGLFCKSVQIMTRG